MTRNPTDPASPERIQQAIQVAWQHIGGSGGRYQCVYCLREAYQAEPSLHYESCITNLVAGLEAQCARLTVERDEWKASSERNRERFIREAAKFDDLESTVETQRQALHAAKQGLMLAIVEMDGQRNGLTADPNVRSRLVRLVDQAEAALHGTRT